MKRSRRKNRRKKEKTPKRRRIVLNVSVSRRRKERRRRRSAGRWGIALAAAALVAGLALVRFPAARRLLEPAGFTVKWVEVSNEDLLGEGEIVRLSGVTFGEGLLSLDLAAVRSRIVAHPDVRDAVVERNLPSGVRIRVYERYPVAAVYRGKRYVVDEKGHVLSGRKEKHARALPIIKGCNTGPLSPGKMLTSARALKALSIITRCADSDLCGLMQLVSVDVTDPDNPVLRTKAIREIRLGSGNVEKRLRLLAYILEQRKYRGLDRPARYLDLRWNNAAEMPEGRVSG